MTFANKISYVPTTYRHSFKSPLAKGIDVMYSMYEEVPASPIGTILWSDSMDKYHFTPDRNMTYIPWTEEQMQEITDKLKDMNLNHKPKEETYEL